MKEINYYVRAPLESQTTGPQNTNESHAMFQWTMIMEGRGTKCVKFVPFQQKPTKRQKFYISLKIYAPQNGPIRGKCVVDSVPGHPSTGTPQSVFGWDFLRVIRHRRNDCNLGAQTLTRRIHGTGIFNYIYHKIQPNVGKYTIHGSYG